MAAEHSDFCPVCDKSRYPEYESHKPCQDATIEAFAMKVHERGFQGFIGFHYYCDPLMNVSRMLSLMHCIKILVPASKFILWTNGKLLKHVHRTWLQSFDKVVITLHDTSDEIRLQEVTTGLSNVQIAPALYDTRMDLYAAGGRVVGPCIRPARIELPINYYGEVRLCCADYRGYVSLGNIDSEPHDKILDGFAEAADLVMQGKVPVCWRCRSMPSSPVAVV